MQVQSKHSPLFPSLPKISRLIPLQWILLFVTCYLVLPDLEQGLWNVVGGIALRFTLEYSRVRIIDPEMVYGTPPAIQCTIIRFTISLSCSSQLLLICFSSCTNKWKTRVKKNPSLLQQAACESGVVVTWKYVNSLSK